MRVRRFCMGLVLLLVSAAASALTPLPEQLGHVSDLAGVMSRDATLQLGSVLSDYAANTGIRIAVLTIDGIEGETAEDCAGRALEIWQTEDSARRSALLLWTGQGQVVIYVGEGLRDRITDAESQLVLNESVIPAAASGSVDQAMMLGAYRLIEMANDVPVAADAEPSPQEEVVVQDSAAFPLVGGAGDALRQDLQVLLSAFSENPAAAASWFAASVQAQASALPTALPANLKQALGAPEILVALVVAGVVLLFIVNATWRITRIPAAPACALLMAGAVLLWLLTRYTELSLLVLLAGPLAWIAWVLWRRRAQRSVETAAPAANAYAAWLAAQQRRQDVLRPSTAGVARPSAAPAAIQPSPKPAASAQLRLHPSQRRLADLLEQLHGAGVATPALDRVLARWRTLTSPEYKTQRTGMLVILVVLGVFFLPLAFLAAAAWAVAELNAVKQPNQKLGEFFRQLSREAQALQQRQSRR